jgi:hypothetical protein
MMEVLRADFKKIPGVLAGDFDIKLPPAFAADPKKPMPIEREKPNQAGLF